MPRIAHHGFAGIAICALVAVAILALARPRAGDGALDPGAAGAAPGSADLARDPFEASGLPAPGMPGAAPTPFERTPARALQAGELVRGPGDRGFDVAAFLAGRGGAGGRAAAIAAVVNQVSVQHAVSARLLLALLELESGAVDGAASGAAAVSVDRVAAMAAWLADGYYGALHRGETDVQFADGRRGPGPAAADPAHFALARYLARGVAAGQLDARLAEFTAVYARLFGPRPVLAPPVPPGTTQPPLLLPWPEGEQWYYTGGPHGAWGIATAWGAVDFAPPSLVGCRSAPEWVVAAAPGVVVWSDDGLVLVDMDGDGYDGTGWVIAYLHMATAGRVAAGAVLAAGDRVGHPSCEGGVADGAHVHFARRLNGQWLPADGGPVPLDLSGWTFTSYGAEYDGSMAHPDRGSRMAVTSRRQGDTEVVSDNGPARRAALADAWSAYGAAAPAALAAAPVVGAGDTGAPPAAEPAVAGDEPAPAADAAFPPASAAPDAGAPPGAATLTVRIALGGRATHAASVVIGIARAGAPPLVLMGRTDAGGVSNAIPLPESVGGVYHVTARVSGYLPAEHVGVALGAGDVVIDFTAGGVVALPAGELDANGAIDAADAALWLGEWYRGGGAADLDGDGQVGVRDAWRLVRNLGGG